MSVNNDINIDDKLITIKYLSVCDMPLKNESSVHACLTCSMLIFYLVLTICVYHVMTVYYPV